MSFHLAKIADQPTQPNNSGFTGNGFDHGAIPFLVVRS